MGVNMCYLERDRKKGRKEGNVEGSSAVGVLWLSKEPKRKCITALGPLSCKTTSFILRISFSPHPVHTTLHQMLWSTRLSISSGVASAWFPETHRTNSLLFGGSSLFEKGGFANTVLTAEERKRNAVMVSSGAF